ncbi:MAG: hypothetical protein MjAS7_2773 [Metallosphaera javensis (ex Sakai et al. 2022)]|nr:MAG: hypothetical protein MjAS7_2773 [Metallosphaera javensis (ex Sakai et al. 2022)]
MSRIASIVKIMMNMWGFIPFVRKIIENVVVLGYSPDDPESVCGVKLA